MKYLNILTGENIVEGIIASISIVLTYYVLRNNFKFSKLRLVVYKKIFSNYIDLLDNDMG